MRNVRIVKDHKMPMTTHGRNQKFLTEIVESELLLIEGIGIKNGENPCMCSPDYGLPDDFKCPFTTRLLSNLTTLSKDVHFRESRKKIKCYSGQIVDKMNITHMPFGKFSFFMSWRMTDFSHPLQ